MPGKTAIKAAWTHYLIEIGKFDSITELWEPQQKCFRDDPELRNKDYCWACGMLEPIERAHILAHQEGGSSDVENLNLLCPDCHEASEMISGSEYLDWLKSRNFLHRVLEQVGRNDAGGFTRFFMKSGHSSIDIATALAMGAVK